MKFARWALPTAQFQDSTLLSCHFYDTNFPIFKLHDSNFLDNNMYSSIWKIAISDHNSNFLSRNFQDSRMLSCKLQDNGFLLYNLPDRNFLSSNLQDRSFLSGIQCAI